MRKIETAVITGPTGAVGTALCERLLRSGVRVYAVVHPGSQRVNALPEGVDVVSCDLAHLAELPELISTAKADAFFHLAWANTTGAGRNDVASQMKNIEYAIDAVHAAKQLGCDVFVGAGSQAEYGRFEGSLRPDTPAFPENGYGIAKLCAGQLTRLECGKLGMDHIWVRILSVYGPHDGMGSMISSVIGQLLRREKPALTEGIQKWDYLYSEDAAEALWLCARCGRNGAVYPLGSGKAAPLRQYIETLRDAIDPALALDFGAIPYGPLQVMHLEADLNALQADTGFQPQVSFEQGIRKTIEWMKHVI